MRRLYPEIEPYRHGLLEVDGQQVYWETCGNPEGKPVVFLHGGPGGGCTPAHRRLFDPAGYRIVLLDQRGCGRSRPHVARLAPDPAAPGRPAAGMAANTTAQLVADLEVLREHLGITRWQVFGGSWGSTLGLAYAQRHVERVTELVLRGIFTGRSGEVDWLYRGGAARFFPERWAEFLAPVRRQRGTATWSPPTPDCSGTATPPWPPAPRRCGAAGRGRCPRCCPGRSWSHSSPGRSSRWPSRGSRTTTWRTAASSPKVSCSPTRERLAGIPGVIVHGRYDVLCPPSNAWDLHRGWPGSELVMVPDAGHAFDEPGILDALIGATDRFR